MIFRMECRKLFQKKKLFAALIAIVILNGCYFSYRSEHNSSSVSAKAYKEITEELTERTTAESMDVLSEQISVLKNALYDSDGASLSSYVRFGKNILEEISIYKNVNSEIKEIAEYPKYLSDIGNKVRQIKALQSFFGTGEIEIRNAEKTEKDYAKLSGITPEWTRTRGIYEALNLPSVIFLQILFGVLFAATLFSREKEQDILKLYVSMENGRGKMFLARMGAVSVAVSICNALFFISTVLTGCFLYGMPKNGFLGMPMQALYGYKGSALPISIGMFLFLVYLWSCLVSLFFAAMTAMLTFLLPSVTVVYGVLSVLIGAEGILYLKIGTNSYLSGFKRFNLVAFSDGAHCLGIYRNEFAFRTLPAYRSIALLSLVFLTLLGLGVLVFLAECGYGYSVSGRAFIRRRRKADTAEKAGTSDKLGITELQKTTQTASQAQIKGRFRGMSVKLFRHEIYKFFIADRMAFLLLLVTGLLVTFSRPYIRGYMSTEERFYMVYLLRLQETEPSEYRSLTEVFDRELQEEVERYGTNDSFFSKSNAYDKICEYVDYLETKPGAVATDSKGYELLYNDRRQNVLLGTGALLLVIMCSILMYFREFRSGMNDLIRVSGVGWSRVNRCKLVILFVTILFLFGCIYGRYIYLVLKGFGTPNIECQANSLMDWAKTSVFISIGGKMVLIYLKRFIGMLVASGIAICVVCRAKSFILSAVICLLVLVVPLLLCLTDVGAVGWIMINWFFV